MFDSREQVDLPPPAPTLDPRVALAAEWQAADPHTEAEILRFYQGAQGLGPDLDAWHQNPERRQWTRDIVHVATQEGVKKILDIGCGAGHDLRALRDALPDAHLAGVEPNEDLATMVADAFNIPVYRSVREDGLAILGLTPVRVETADLLICIDVLEHVVNPESFLASIAERAPLGCLLMEATATSDTGTPLHLRENWGWHPGRVLERHGWEQVSNRNGRLTVWRRMAQAGRERATMLLCAYRSVNAEMLTSLLALCAGNEIGWRLRTKTGDALISRSRSIVTTAFWRETNDDVFLMVDDDIVFSADDADRLVEWCRNGKDIICGAYPVHDGGHMACRFFPGAGKVTFGPGGRPIEIEYAATGMMAVHRRVLDALIADLPLCHANQPWSFYPLFQARLVEHPENGVTEWLSEDWGFCQSAREHGFSVWIDPETVLKHVGPASISVRNMAAMHEALHSV